MEHETTEIAHIGLDELDPSPWQTRVFPKKDTGLVELAESIGSVGVLQPILVRPIGNRFEILAGERRTRAWGLRRDDGSGSMMTRR